MQIVFYIIPIIFLLFYVTDIKNVFKNRDNAYLFFSGKQSFVTVCAMLFSMFIKEYILWLSVITFGSMIIYLLLTVFILKSSAVCKFLEVVIISLLTLLYMFWHYTLSDLLINISNVVLTWVCYLNFNYT